MGVVVYWYVVVCVAIVGIAMLGSIYVLWRKEMKGRRQQQEQEKSMYMYDSLLIPTLHNYPTDDTNTTNLNTSVSMSVVIPPKAHVSSCQLWATCWRGLHPAWLLGLRVVSFFVLATFLSWDIKEWGASIFIYYTEWSFSLVMIYFAIGSVISAHGCWSQHSADSKSAHLQGFEAEGYIEEKLSSVSRDNKLQSQGLERAGFWGYFMQTAYQTCAGAVMLTDVVFWCIIVPFLSTSRLGLNLLMGCMHTVNITLLLLDTSINRLPFPCFRLAYLVLWSSGYVVFQWVIHLFGFSCRWPYSFLELSTPLAPLWYFILAVFLTACYGLYALIVRVKDSLFSKLFPNSYMKSHY